MLRKIFALPVVLLVLTAVGCSRRQTVYCQVTERWLNEGRVDSCWVSFGAVVAIDESGKDLFFGRVVRPGEKDLRRGRWQCRKGVKFRINSQTVRNLASEFREASAVRADRRKRLDARLDGLKAVESKEMVFSEAELFARLGRCHWVELVSVKADKPTCYLKAGTRALLIARGEKENLYEYVSPEADPALTTCYPQEQFFLPEAKH